MRKLYLAGLLAVAALVLAAVGLTASSKNAAELTAQEQHLLDQSSKTFNGGTKSGSSWDMTLVGQNDLGGRGFNADIDVYKGYAYIGHWGFADSATGNARFCPEEPSSGVAVVDARDPAHPVRVATLQNPAHTSAEDMNVFTARYGPYAGRDLAVVGIQACGSRYDRSIFRGLQVFNVTNPTKPVEIGRLNTGCCTRGLHETDYQHRTDLGRTYVYASVPASEYPDTDSPSGVRDEAKRGDFRLIDITDPTKPVEVSNWGVIHDLGAAPAAGQGCDPDPIYGHSVAPSEDGKLAFISYWDSGFIAVDVSDPAHPVYKGRTVYPPNADGDGHSASYDSVRKLLFAADEDFCKTSPGTEKGFGYLRIYDERNLAKPVQIGSYKTPNGSGASDPGAGDYTIHQPELYGQTIYASWYSDGVQVIDVSDPRAPMRVAYFVPPAAQNPVKPAQRDTLTNTTQVWGVAVDEATGLVYLSDMNSGLWIVRRTS
jgi:hypothetical protein